MGANPCLYDGGVCRNLFPALHLAAATLGGVETGNCTPGRGAPNCNLTTAPPPPTTPLPPPATRLPVPAPALPLLAKIQLYQAPIMATINWRTINIDALDPDSPANFDLSSLTPAVAPVSTADVQNHSQQIRQLLRGGDNEGALQGALENPPYGADDKGKVRLDMLPNTTVGVPRIPSP